MGLDKITINCEECSSEYIVHYFAICEPQYCTFCGAKQIETDVEIEDEIEEDDEEDFE